MDEFLSLPEIVTSPSRHFGACVERGITAMNSISLNVARVEGRLGGLAMQFRGSRRDEECRVIATDYTQMLKSTPLVRLIFRFPAIHSIDPCLSRILDKEKRGQSGNPC